MIKLKILPDIQMDCCKDDGHNEGVFRMYHRTREEAIKWAKSNILHIEEHSHEVFDWDESYLDCLQCRNYMVQIKWIMRFFKISTEEVMWKRGK